MSVTVTPESFSFVEFEASEIAAIVERLIPDVGLPADVDITVNVDERVPMGKAEIVSLDPIVLDLEGGALEDPKKPRHPSEAGSADILGRLLLRVNDRLDADFGAPDVDAEIALAHKVSWDVYCVARLARKGYRAQKQRRLYSFRNRHGFTDETDLAFEQLWTTEDITWADIVGISDAASAARDAVSA